MFSNYFCWMIEGSGSVPLTNGSGSGRPKNLRIQIWIRYTEIFFIFFIKEHLGSNPDSSQILDPDLIYLDQ
jgi:hypothetical protein